jgi:ribonuclease BN (tRNA processing enzyme)
MWHRGQPVRLWWIGTAAALVALACGPNESPRRPEAETPAVQQTSPRTRVVLLGTGTPNAEPNRSGPAVAVVVDGVPYVVDLGPGVVRRAAAAYRAGVEGLAAQNLRVAFITHLHTDHTLGYPDFIFTPWVLERDRPAEVYGPAGLRAMTEHLLAAYEADVRIRIEGLEPANPEGYRVNAHEVGPGLIFEDERVRVFAFPVEHGSWAQAFGYRFETPDRTVVISGDTRATRSVVEACRGCDILIHEVYSQAGFERRSPEWQRYHAAFHTSAPDLGRLAAEARPGLLVLYHQLLWGATPEELVAEIRRYYDGPIAYGRDLDVF